MIDVLGRRLSYNLKLNDFPLSTTPIFLGKRKAILFMSIEESVGMCIMKSHAVFE